MARRPLWKVVEELVPWDELSASFRAEIVAARPVSVRDPSGPGLPTEARTQHLLVESERRGAPRALLDEIRAHTRTLIPNPRAVPIHFDRFTQAPLGRIAFESFLLNPIEASQDLIREGAATMVAICSAAAVYAKYGQQAFRIGPEVQGQFLRSGFKGLSFDDLRAPFPGFYVQVPGSGQRVWGGRTGWHELAGFYVTWFDSAIGVADAGVGLVLWGAENERSGSPGDDAVLHLGIPATLFEEGDIETAVATVFMKGKHFADAMTVLQAPTPEILAVHRETVLWALHILLALILYLRTERPETPPTPETLEARRERAVATKILRGPHATKKAKKQRRLERTLTHLSSANVVDVAPTLERHLAVGGRAPRIRHWVRGHFKRVTRGGRTAWIQPYERGKDAPIALPRTYVPSID